RDPVARCRDESVGRRGEACGWAAPAHTWAARGMTAEAGSTTRSAPGTVSIVIITYRRAATLRTNLEHLARQTRPADQVLVIDGCEDQETERVTQDFGFAEYVRNPRGAGNMTSSRNAALSRVSSDLIAFLDDDAFAEPAYVHELMAFVERMPSADLG